MSANSVIVPLGVIRPILLGRVNQRLPSGPVTISIGAPLPEGKRNSVITPSAATRPILPPSISVNQSCLSGPRVIEAGELFAVAMANSVTGNIGAGVAVGI